MAKVRVNATMDPETVARVDQYAERMGINRSAALSVLAGQALDTQDGIRALAEISAEIQRERGKAQVPSVPETGGA